MIPVSISAGNKHRGMENYDLCFGGRRQFCKEGYADLGTSFYWALLCTLLHGLICVAFLSVSQKLKYGGHLFAFRRTLQAQPY